MDTYIWSDKDRKYGLENSQFTFKILKEAEDSELDILNQGDIKDVSNTITRYLYVLPDHVHFESVEEGRVKNKTVLKSQLSDNKEKLLVYFSEQRKNDILSGLLLASDIKLDPQKNQKDSFSDYSCEIKNKKLICVINYLKIVSGVDSISFL